MATNKKPHPFAKNAKRMEHSIETSAQVTLNFQQFRIQ